MQPLSIHSQLGAVRGKREEVYIPNALLLLILKVLGFRLYAA